MFWRCFFTIRNLGIWDSLGILGIFDQLIGGTQSIQIMYTDVYCIQYNIILVLLDLTDQIIELLYNYTVYQIQILTQLDLTKSLKEKRQEIQLNVVGCCWVYRIFSVFHTGRWKQQEKLTNNHGDSMFARGRHENRAMKKMWFQPINAFECWQWCFRQIVHVFIPGLGDDHGWSIRFFDFGDGLNYQAVATDVGVHWNVASGE